jgi:hypothetical protein
VLLGEFGILDTGDNAISNTDTTTWSASESAWLSMMATYTKSQLGATTRSWFVWAWNANSQDTKGIIGPQTTWRHLQWTKVHALVKQFGLRPWYCAAAPVKVGKAYGCPK